MNVIKENKEFIKSSNVPIKESAFRRQSIQTVQRRQDTSMKKKKRFRSAFTTEQVEYLEKEFKKSPYINNDRRREVAKAINITEKAIKIWFQNRRMKEKNKDTIAKEHEDDDKSCYKISTFNNDLLNNVPMTLSNNDANSSSSLNTRTLIDLEKQYLKETVTNSTEVQTVSEAILYKELLPKGDQTFALDIDLTRTSKERGSLPASMNNCTSSFKSSGEFSIDLCKKYKSDIDFKQSKKLSFEEIISTSHQAKQNKSNDEKYYSQNVPEDLSCNKVAWKPDLDNITFVGPSTSNTIEFRPVLVAQPYISASNIIWNSLNVTPILPTSTSSITISNISPESQSKSQESEKPKKTCSCYCHLS